jgi:hypothetical protein
MMSARRPNVSLLIAVLVALGLACSSVRTNYDFDPATDFSTWSTYAWYPSGATSTGGARLESPLLHARVRAAIDRTLVAAGYSQTQSGAPDFYVNYHLSTQQKLDVQTINRGYSTGGTRGRRGAGWNTGRTETRVSEYEEGTLVVDFADDERQLVWRGSGTRRLKKNPKPDQVTKKVDEAVAEVLGQFPPQT